MPTVRKSPRSFRAVGILSLVGIDFGDAKPLSETLWDDTEDIRKEVMQTPFISGLKSGTLDPIAFEQYLVQDAVYCYRAKLNFDLAASRSEGEMKLFFLQTSKNYTEYYTAMFTDLNIANPEGIVIHEACQAYIDYEAHVASTYDPIYLIVASIPCGRLWPWIGDNFKTESANCGVYQNWVDENFTGSGYKNLEAWMDGKHGTEVDEVKAESVYTQCMKNERDFFGSV